MYFGFTYWVKKLGVAGMVLSLAICIGDLAKINMSPPKCVKNKTEQTRWQEKCRNNYRSAANNCSATLGTLIGALSGPTGIVVGGIIGTIVGKLFDYFASDNVVDTLGGCGKLPKIDPCCNTKKKK